MKIFRGFKHPGLAPNCAVTIGNFDGVHRGHQAMLALLAGEAAQRGIPTCVLTFEPHPATTSPRNSKNPNWPLHAWARCATSSPSWSSAA